MEKLNKQKVGTEPYKGVRDFYPEDMAIQNYIFGVWKKTVESFGYSEYGASVLEYADLYKAKSGEEIVNSQTYTFMDKGDREVSLRPEMTPTVARMIAAKLKEFSFPLRWYSIPNLFRYENPQRGRMREHWQLNVDIFGVKNINAEAEVISVATHIMRNFGLKDSDFEIRLNNRKIVNFLLKELFDLPEETSYKTAKLIDRKDKMPAKEFADAIKELMPDDAAGFLEIINSKNFDEFISHVPEEARVHEGIKEVQDLLGKLEEMGISNVIFDQTIMRGFDYYTGIVFEIFDKNPENRRAVFGGGRYDELLSIFGTETVSAVGFGMGDVVIKDILETYGLLPKITPSAKLHLCVMDENSLGYAQNLAQKIRNLGMSVTIDYSGKKIGDQIKYAEKNYIPFITVIGENEMKTNDIVLKRLSNGVEKIMTNISEDIKDIVDYINTGFTTTEKYYQNKLGEK